MDDLVGKVLDNAYRVDKLLGEGGMGSVYKGHDVALDRDVAIKVMHPFVARQEGFRERFLQEARAIALLDHPGIVHVYSFSRNTELLYIVMSFVTGQNLRDWEQTLVQRNQMMALNDSLSLVAQIANALDYAHRRGVFHRDIKPGNIILRPLQAGEVNMDGLPFQPILTDFGLAKLAEGGMLSMTGMAMGTPAYMSPEQCEGKPVDGRTDIYALGIVLYELVTGKVPFDVKTLTEALHAHTQEPPPPPRSLNATIPSQVEEIVLKALAKPVDQRYASASLMEQVLRTAGAALPQAKSTEATIGGPVGYVSMSTLVGQDEAQAAPSKDNWPTPPSAIPVGGRVLVLSPDGQSRSVTIGDRKQLAIGRDQGVDVMLSDARVSRRHAQVVFDGNKYDVTDLNSTNGTFMDNNRLLPGVPETWRQGQSLRVGDHWLRLELQGVGQPVQPRPASSSFPSQQVPQGTLQSPGIQVGSNLVNASLEPDQLSVRPGEYIDCTVRIMNGQAQVDHFSVQVEGIPADWVKRPDVATRLVPGDVGTITLRISPPKLPASTAGQHPFTVRVLSQVNPNQPVILPGQLELLPFNNLAVGLQPSTFTNKGQGQVTLVNMGNAAETVALSGADPSGILIIGTPPGQVTINAGEQKSVALTVRGKGGRPIVGNSSVLPFMINTLNARGEKQIAQGNITIKPYLPAWALPLLMMLVLALCGGTIFAISAYQKDQNARSTATAVVIANSTAVVVSTAQVIETKTAQAINEAKTGAAMNESEKKTATAASISEAKTATFQAASEAKTATAQSESEAKTSAAMSASEAKTATAQAISDEKTATANAPTITPTPVAGPTATGGLHIVKPLVPIGKIINLGTLLKILPDWKDNFAASNLDGWFANPSGVASLSGANLVMNYGDDDAWFIQQTNAKDFTYVAKVTMYLGIGMGLAFRSSLDGLQDYEVYLDIPNGNFIIAKRPWQVLAVTPVSLAYNTAYTVRVEITGSSITAAIDDLNVSITASDTSYTQGYFGLHVYRGQAAFSNLAMYWR